MGRVILVSAAILYSVLHSLAASNRVKAYVQAWFGSSTKRWYRLGYNLFAGLTFLPIIWLLAILPDQTLYTVDLPWLVLTSAGQIAGAVIIMVGILQTNALTFIGIRQLFSPELSHEETVFISGGLYRWVRHPLYTGGLLIIWLTPVMTTNLLALFTVMTVYLVVGASLEERRLAKEFGNHYRRYQHRVPMLVPYPRRRVKNEEV
jgi:protein-S-isoprenylcysteine O-methyltransferase Ste14